jgi:hypothetical protein
MELTGHLRPWRRQMMSLADLAHLQAVDIAIELQRDVRSKALE